MERLFRSVVNTKYRTIGEIHYCFVVFCFRFFMFNVFYTNWTLSIYCNVFRNILKLFFNTCVCVRTLTFNEKVDRRIIIYEFYLFVEDIIL